MQGGRVHISRCHYGKGSSYLLRSGVVVTGWAGLLPNKPCCWVGSGAGGMPGDAPGLALPFSGDAYTLLVAGEKMEGVGTDFL